MILDAVSSMIEDVNVYDNVLIFLIVSILSHLLSGNITLNSLPDQNENNFKFLMFMNLQGWIRDSKKKGFATIYSQFNFMRTMASPVPRYINIKTSLVNAISSLT